jgi:hypothetical protein
MDFITASLTIATAPCARCMLPAVSNNNRANNNASFWRALA